MGDMLGEKVTEAHGYGSKPVLNATTERFNNDIIEGVKLCTYLGFMASCVPT